MSAQLARLLALEGMLADGAIDRESFMAMAFPLTSGKALRFLRDVPRVTSTEVFRQVILCGGCGAPVSESQPECDHCGAFLRIL